MNRTQRIYRARVPFGRPASVAAALTAAAVSFVYVTAAALLTPGTARAQLFGLAPGTAIGEFEQAVYAGAAGGPGPVFAVDDGQMLQPGGGYPSLGLLINELDTGLIGLPGFLARAQDAQYGGGFANLTPVNGWNRAGLVSTNFFVRDFNVNGFISANTFGGTADFVNTGPFAAVGNVGNFLGMTAFVDPLNVNSFVAVGVRSVIEVGVGVGAGFVPVNTLVATPIVMAFDGVGRGRPDFIQADRFLFQTPNLTTLRFSAVSTLPVVVPVGATMRVRGTLTLYADPSDVSFDIFPLNDPSLGVAPDFGTGGSSNADAVLGSTSAPEPGTFSLAAIALLGVAIFRHRQQQHGRPSAASG